MVPWQKSLIFNEVLSGGLLHLASTVEITYLIYFWKSSSFFISYCPNRNILSITHLRKINPSDLYCSIFLLMNQNEIFSPLHKWEIGPIATHVLELIFHTAKMIQSFHYTFGKSRQFGPMFQYFRHRYLNCHFLSVTHIKNRDRPMIETLWQNQGVPAGVWAVSHMHKMSEGWSFFC